MRKLCSFWWVPYIAALVLAFVNPHIGILATVLLLPLFMIFVGEILLRHRKKTSVGGNGALTAINKISAAISKAIVPVCVLVFYLASAFIVEMFWLVWSGRIGDPPVAIFPWNIWQGINYPSAELGMNIIMLVLLVVALIQYFIRIFTVFYTRPQQ